MIAALRKGMLYLFVCFVTTTAFCQNTIGLPDVINYPQQVYGAGTQNWDIEQDRNGIMYFANNEGLLSFDGTFWKNYPLPNRTKLRSVKLGNDHQLYAGGEGEFGYFSPDAAGLLHFHSLLSLVPEGERSFTDVWDICVLGKDVFFRAANKIFLYSNNALTLFKPASHWRFMGMSNGLLVAEDFENGLLCYNNGSWQPFLTQSDLPKTFLATAFIPFGKDSSLLVTLEDGLFIITGSTAAAFRSPALPRISLNRIYGAVAVNDRQFALATSLDGCYVIDRQGNLVQSISTPQGLQNNNVRSLFTDASHNLWVGTDDGIDFIAYNNAIRHIYPETKNIGPGYAALLHKGNLYMGTSNGLSKIGADGQADISLLQGNFEPVEGTKGQVWGLSEVNGNLLLAHHEGAFVVKDNQVEKIIQENGYWNFFPLTPVFPAPLIVAGSYNGINFFDYHPSTNSFQKKGMVAHFNEAARFMAIENEHTIWVSHPYRGIYKVSIAADGSTAVKPYTNKNGLPVTTNNNFIFKIRNQLIAATEKGIYQYNHQKDGFEPSPYFKDLFGEKRIFYMKEDLQGNIWFIQDKQLGVVDFSGSLPHLIYFPELNEKLVSGFEYIYPVDPQNVLVGAQKGFYHINLEAYKHIPRRVQVQLRLVKAMGKADSLVFGGYMGEVNDTLHQSRRQMPQMGYNFNSFHFEFSAALYGQQSSIEYSYLLKGFDKNWSAWSKKTEKDYTNLPAGSYIFQVKARNNPENESLITTYTFTILPPWYQTYWAYGLYLLLLLAGMYLLYLRQGKQLRKQEQQHEEERKRLQYLHQLELEKSEREIMKLKNEKLEADIHYKNAELASSAMHLVQKTEILGTIKTDLTRIMKGIESEKTNDELKKLIKMLGEENKTDQDWEHFSVHFDSVHSNFLVSVKEKYPVLNAGDLKLCAYLRMNLSSKEMARLMNISVRGVEISRYRLRKKLQIPTEVNLVTFFLELHSEKSRPPTEQKVLAGL